MIIRMSGAEKQKCTLMLVVTADGCKLPPYIIFRRKTIPKGNSPRDIHVRIQENLDHRGTDVGLDQDSLGSTAGWSVVPIHACSGQFSRAPRRTHTRKVEGATHRHCSDSGQPHVGTAAFARVLRISLSRTMLEGCTRTEWLVDNIS